jgi:hypothetical protein
LSAACLVIMHEADGMYGVRIALHAAVVVEGRSGGVETITCNMS